MHAGHLTIDHICKKEEGNEFKEVRDFTAIGKTVIWEICPAQLALN